MTLTFKATLALFVTACLFALALIISNSYAQPAKAAGGFLPATIATSSNPTVTSTAGTLIATSSCSARIITTSASAIMLTFSDYAGQTPTGSFGHLQPASTTVAYDAGLYGCGLVKVFSYTTQLVTVSDVR